MSESSNQSSPISDQKQIMDNALTSSNASSSSSSLTSTSSSTATASIRCALSLNSECFSSSSSSSVLRSGFSSYAAPCSSPPLDSSSTSSSSSSSSSSSLSPMLRMELLCGECKTDPATFYCSECTYTPKTSGAFCKACSEKAHNDNQIMKRHGPFSYANRPYAKILCSSHSSDVASEYCATCKVFLCSSCRWQKHGIAQEQHEIKSLDTFRKEELIGLQATMKEFKEHLLQLSSLVHQDDTTIESIKAHYDAALKNVRKHFEPFGEVGKKRAAEVEASLTSELNKRLNGVLARRSHLNAFVQEGQRLHGEAEALLSSRSGHLFEWMHAMQQQLLGRIKDAKRWLDVYELASPDFLLHLSTDTLEHAIEQEGRLDTVMPPCATLEEGEKEKQKADKEKKALEEQKAAAEKQLSRQTASEAKQREEQEQHRQEQERQRIEETRALQLRVSQAETKASQVEAKAREDRQAREQAEAKYREVLETPLMKGRCKRCGESITLGDQKGKCVCHEQIRWKTTRARCPMCKFCGKKASEEPTEFAYHLFQPT
eukprot:TRINITY_DN1725_c0_g3_i1.p1 TRINITY_DN1725_c0_g3~~TRINITY_DN1725_c0_g3_i1.p1  ORF type:complete len:545 (+),score=132.09 TRINITY_DN1725_c0_g3_i1:78-1712(+)